MKILRILLIGFIISFFVIPQDTYAKTVSEKYEVSWSVWIPCANDGLGELAVGTMMMHEVRTYDKNGLLTKIHNQPQSGELIGQVTGIKYKPTGVTQTNWDTNFNGAYTFTYINNYHMVGPGIQFFVKEKIHVTINANGELTSEVISSEVICK